MASLTPLIELASHKSLDLFFRVGQGYVARSTGSGAGQRGGDWGLNPVGIQARAEARIVGVLPPPSPDTRLHAWPDGRHTAPPKPLRR